MLQPFKKKRQWIGRGLVFVFLIGIVSSGLALSAPSPVFAADNPVTAPTKVAAEASKTACLTTGATPSVCPGGGISGAISAMWDGLITPALKMVAIKALVDFVSYASNRIAYEAAVYVANGGPGEGSMFYRKSATEAWKSFGKDIGGQAYANLSDISKSSFGLDLCVPPNPMIRLNLQLSIKQNYTPTKPRCDFDQVNGAWGQIVSDTKALLTNDKDAAEKFLFNKLSEGLRPGSNQLGASIGFLSHTYEKSAKIADQKVVEQNASKSIGGFTDVKDLVTGETKTPAAIVAKDFDKKLKAADNDENKVKTADIIANPDVWYGLLNMSVSTFTNTLTSQLFNRVYKGLFSPKPDNFDPFNAELAVGSGGNTDANKADLGGIFTATPVANLQFDLLGEFTQCLPEGTGNRGLNSCVIDASVVSAISRGGSAAALTVQEAIDQKVLKGDWPLISSKNIAANQDRLCYTYGFCYGNLVKLRKARIISIGWELAADKNSLSNPTSLSDIVAGFYDPKSLWYHLIDPNWVLKAPETQCRASVNGEIRVSAQAPGRQNVCADTPTCIGEDNTGKCTQGFGYCVEEKNIWRVKGDECPAQYATCLMLQNTKTGKANSFLLNTVDNANCTKQNAGCSWSKTQKSADAKGVFQWYNGTIPFDVGVQNSSMKYAGSTPFVPNIQKTKQTDYAYQDRLYLTHSAKKCDQEQAGCTELNVKDSKLALNLVQNGSFEKDEDQNGKPDLWSHLAVSNPNVDSVTAVDGSKSAKLDGEINQSILITPKSFFTFSTYTTATDNIGSDFQVVLQPFDITGAAINITGLSSGGDCIKDTVGQQFVSGYTISANATIGNWKRFTCTFTAPQNVNLVRVRLIGSTNSPNVRFDAVQLESGEVASTFGDGYNVTTPQKAYLKLPPAYLGCKGLASDPKECAAYTQVCSAQDVGCNLYTPKESGPAVPAIASALDACPNVCVGYDAYRQEGTRYEPAKFPVYFIADKAGVCSKNAVGCDGFTKLGTNGGETQEHYTNLRACLTGEMAIATPEKTSATYFTWEGSDTSGFQLKTWQLLQSNVNLAPCITPNVESESSVKCADVNPVPVEPTCKSHADIFTNADCREFFDSTGDVHYRLFSKTVTVDSACTAYRKNTSTALDCKASGGFWTAQGFCRYFGLQKESKVCSAAENGCREYTGGAARNAATILNETFEGGTYAAFTATTTSTPSLSNDSIASGGHSLSVFASGDDTGVRTANATLSSSLAKGKVYIMQFWAKGSGTLSAGFQDANNGAKHYFVQDLPLSNTWDVYNVGPMDTNSFAAFNKDATLFFTTKSQKTFFIDNIRLTETEEHITRIKDSWVTPAVCDQSPDGAAAPQYYLGCKAYTDRKGVEGSYYQFSNICSENVIGCSAYYNTFNSDSASGQVANARCVNLGAAGVPANTPVGTLPNGKAAVGNVACIVNGTTYCTISSGQNYCVFSTKQVFQDPLPSDAKFGIVYGPETVVTPQDQSIYLVDNGSAQCSVEFKGCKEVGAPTYAQDLKTVTKFDSKYVMDTPDDYKNILCENQALFCDEFSSTKDGNFYFKDPLNKTCEYKTSVNIAGKTFKGWFRSGKSEPCYWTDKNANGKFDPASDNAYLVAGDQAQIWKNGDAAYDGWIGACETAANRCTEFQDATDTSSENHGKGKSYFVINNDKLSENTVSASQKCEGKVGQKGGCALFNNTTVSQLKYSSSASYVLSLHADLLLSKSQNSLVDPISCKQNQGVFTVSADAAQQIGLGSATSVDLCARRCEYKIALNDSLLSPGLTTVPGATVTTGYERSCLMVSDCPTLKTKLGNELKATACAQVTQRVADDANTVLKVNRDRTCAAWLACDSARTTWDPNANKYIQICDSVNLCTQVGSQGDQAQCQSWTERPALVMTEQLYASRDVSWAGTDFSGYEIPHQLPVEQFSQFNVNPKMWCENNNKITCSDSSGCVAFGGDCVEASPDYRLVFNAGSCDSKKAGDGSACIVGKCTDGSGSCAVDNDCKSGTCQKGYCSIDGSVSITTLPDGSEPCKKNADLNCSCQVDADCALTEANGGMDTPFCNTVRGVCVSKIGSCSATSDCKEHAGHACIPIATTTSGNCFNDRCVTGIRDANNDGFPEPVTKDLADYAQSCRGYPEIDSPFPQKVVKLWKVYPKFDPTKKAEVNAAADYLDLGANASLATQRSVPSQFVAGYDASKVCTPYVDEDSKQWVISDHCVNTCSYTKAIYAKGGETRYYPTDLSLVDTGKVPDGICTGGVSDGSVCKSDADCATADNKNPGTCQLLTAANTMFGWQGYCLEKDSSIQLNGSTAAKDQACLTWLPVDQLAGATDLYGKETSAGYQIAKSTYYCAQPGIAYDLRSTGQNDYACAETNDGNCNDAETLDAFQDDEPHKNIWCPKGYVAFMGPCGDVAPSGYCTQGGDDDYPYFCVPRLSYHTSGDLEGQACKFPGEDPSDLNPVPNYTAITKTSVTRPAPLNVKLYFSDATKWETAKKFYADCVVKGVTDAASLTNYLGTESPSGVASKGSGADGSESYRGFNLNAKSYAACQTIAQVGATSLQSGVYNAAWTDRVWQNVNNKYAIQEANGSVDSHLGYTVTSPLVIYGQTLDLGAKNANKDPDPMRIFMCGAGGDKFPKADGTCDDGKPPTTPNEARAYGSFSLLPPQFAVTGQTSYCKNADCSCEVSTGATDCNTKGEGSAPTCKNTKATCVGGTEDTKTCMSAQQKTDCDIGKGVCKAEAGTCNGGPKNNQACMGDIDCVVNVCRSTLVLKDGFFTFGSYCTDKEAIEGKTTIGGFNPADARARLQQIFARSLSIHNFDDGFKDVVIVSADPTKPYGKYEKLSPAPADWLWDQRATANGSKPPVITSIGNCVGSACSEKTDGKFNVNGFDSGDVQGLGSKHVSVTFYVHADSNQMPLRNIVVDWGDDMQNISSEGNPWPNGSYGGSKESTNFYKNHRGLTKGNAPKEICSSKATEFGLSPEACSSSYVLFSHDYVCTSSDVNALLKAGRTCGNKDPKTGSVVTSPCVKTEGEQQFCQFQPRVHAKDNWGWCTGYCDANPSGGDSGTACFSQECDLKYPSTGLNITDLDKKGNGKTVNPWTYFDGTIKIKPVQ